MNNRSSVVEEIANQYVRYARSIAREWSMKVPSSIDMHDLESAALEGLHSAATKFDPEHGVQFPAYARQFIVGRIKSMLRSFDTLTRGERQDAGEIAAATAALLQLLSRFPTDAEIADHIGVDPVRVRQVKNAIHERTPESLTAAELVPMSDFHMPEESALVGEQNNHIRLAVDTLPESMREVIEMIYFEAMAVNEVATRLGITHEAVSQRHMKGRELLRLALSDFIGRELADEPSRVSDKQRHGYLDGFRSAISDSSAMIRRVSFAA